MWPSTDSRAPRGLGWGRAVLRILQGREPGAPHSRAGRGVTDLSGEPGTFGFPTAGDEANRRARRRKPANTRRRLRDLLLMALAVACGSDRYGFPCSRAHFDQLALPRENARRSIAWVRLLAIRRRSSQWVYRWGVRRGDKRSIKGHRGISQRGSNHREKAPCATNWPT
jgi:hypothetical protein